VSLNFVILKHVGVISHQKKTTAKILQYGFYWPTMFKDTHEEFLYNLLLTFETYPSGNVHYAFHNL
jgi:hypothetical protein